MTMRVRHLSTGPTALALTALLALGATACSGGDGATDTTAPTSSASSASTASSSTTTTTEQPTTTTTKAPRRKPEPVYPLTGLGPPDKHVMTMPALVVKVDNAPGARPQTGFNSADLVVEELVNDGYTRFAMVFHSHGSNPVGPIRSGRLQDVDLFGMLHGPLFAWSGGNATVTAAIRGSDLIEVGPFSAARSAYYRSGDRSAPHNLYATTDALWSFAPDAATAPPQLFRYRAKGDGVQGVEARGVALGLDTIDVQWQWDAASGTWLRTMEGSPHVDRGTGAQVSAANVVVLVMQYSVGISGSPDAQSLGTGEALVFTNGRYVHGTWSRKDRLSPFRLHDHKGRPILLTPGRTFIELPRAGQTTPIQAD